MNYSFLIGMVGALVGGLILAIAVYSAYLLEVSQRKKSLKAAQKDISDFLNEIKGLNKSSGKVSGKFN